MTSFHVYIKKLDNDEIEVVDTLDTKKEFIQTSHHFGSEEEAKDWIRMNSTSYVIRKG